jgi:hypothetical protein
MFFLKRTTAGEAPTVRIFLLNQKEPTVQKRQQKNSSKEGNREPEEGWAKLCTQIYPRKEECALVFRDPVSL